MLNKTSYTYGTQPSGIRELFMYGLQKKKELGEDKVYDYSLGNPSIPAPQTVKDTVKRLLDETDPVQLHGYSVAAGFEDARQKVADNLNERYGCKLSAKNLFFTCGAAPALIAVFRALAVDENSQILAIAPFFPEYQVFTEGSANCKFDYVPADLDNFQINFQALEEKVKKDTVAVIINSPNNPSGVVFSEETIVKLGQILEAKSQEYGHTIYLIADEPYRELVYGDAVVPYVPGLVKNTIVCYSWSKSLSLPGERIGYVLVPDECDNAADLYAAVSGAARLGGHVCAPTLWQRVVGECCGTMPDLVAYNENRELLYNSLTEMGYHCARPDGAFYLFVEAPGGDSEVFSEKAKLEQNLLVVPGTGFGCKSYFRLSYCVSNDMIRRSLPAFKALIEQYK